MISKIGFAPDLVPDILSRNKTVSFRLGPKYAEGLITGSVIDAVNSQTNLIFGKLKILRVTKAPISNVSLNFPGHEQYISRNEFIYSMSKHYPSEAITENSIISVIEFDIF